MYKASYHPQEHAGTHDNNRAARLYADDFTVCKISEINNME